MNKANSLKMPSSTENRVFELDFLRGLSIVMMILHHIIYDLRYILEIDVFAWQESFFFQNILRPPFVFIFLFVSGVCCTFSRSNIRRSLRLAAVAAAFSVVFFIVSRVTQTEMYLVSNIIFILCIGTLICGLTELMVKKKVIRSFDTWMIVAALSSLVLNGALNLITPFTLPWLSPLHRNFETGFGMSDYMPLLPWISMFFAGALAGRWFYKSKKSIFSEPPVIVRRILDPFIFIGRHSLLFYLLHQPVVLLILYVLRFTGIL